MKFEAVRIFLSSSKNFATMATWRVTTSLYCVNILRNIMPQYTTKQDFLRYTDIFTPHFIDDRVSSGYLLFNARVWIHGNQGPWFGENFIIAKKPKRDQLRRSLQSSLIMSCIMSCICIKWKSSRFLSPVSMVSAKNTWDHDSPRVLNKKKRKRLADYDSPCYATSSNYKIKGYTVHVQ